MKQTKLNKRFDLTQVILNIFSTCIQTLKSYWESDILIFIGSLKSSMFAILQEISKETS